MSLLMICLLGFCAVGLFVTTANREFATGVLLLFAVVGPVAAALVLYQIHSGAYEAVTPSSVVGALTSGVALPLLARTKLAAQRAA